MTENRTETIRYAIRMPNGNLLDGLGDAYEAGARWTKLVDGESTYLWEEQAAAEKTLTSIAATIGFGIGDKFEELSEVVEVRTVTTMTIRAVDADGDEPANLPDYHQLPDGLEKSVRSLISILEEGQQRDPNSPVNVPALIMQLRVMVGHNFAATEDEPAGEREPRRWDSVLKIPVGVQFRVGSYTRIYERCMTYCLHLDSRSIFHFDRFGEGPGVFVEVLS